ncbi:MAG: flagellar basal body rod C-terminal domain-containing protein [bacterium]
MNRITAIICIITVYVSYSVYAVSNLDDSFSINISGILAQRTKMMIIAENVANLNTLKDEETGLPYQKKYIQLEKFKDGVKVTGIKRSTEPFGRYFDPAAPQADENGYFYYPNVNLPNEMMTLTFTEAVYEANITALKVSKSMYQSAIELMK